MISSRSRTPTTPFIPPLISPEGSPAPGIPLETSTTPHYSPNPGGPTYLYPTSPYANAPFIPPPLSPLQTPGVIPGVIPSSSQSGGPRQGLSEDYTGYPSGRPPPSSPSTQPQPPPQMTPMTAGYGQIPPQMTPMTAGYGQLPPNSPWHPTSAPAGFTHFNTTPWGPPPVPLPSPWAINNPQPFSPYSFTPGAFTPAPLPGGQPLWGMQPGMPPPGPPSIPPPRRQPAFPPGSPEWFQQQQAAAAFQQQQQQAAFQQQQQAAFQQQQQAAAMQQAGFGGPPPFRRGPDKSLMYTDRMPPFTQGPHYIPVLKPMEAYILDVPIMFHPLLQPLPEDGSERPYLKWNMLFPTATIHRSSDSASQSWIEGRDQPATFPRLIAVNIISESFPWLFTLHAARKNSGITCGEIIEGIAHGLGKATGDVEYNTLSPQQRREVNTAYRQNRSRSIDAPGGILGEGMKRLDFLGRHTMFDGLVVNDRVVEKLLLNKMPATFLLKCSAPLPMSREEQREQEIRMRSKSSQGHRSRANSTNTRITVEPPSSADSDVTDNDHGFR